jgi:hypothetical protein
MINNLPENVKPKDWIFIGTRNAVICKIYKDYPNRIEVVYLDRNRAINEDAQYINGKWEFVVDGPNGGYADDSPRLAEFVAILRADRWWEKSK